MFSFFFVNQRYTVAVISKQKYVALVFYSKVVQFPDLQCGSRDRPFYSCIRSRKVVCCSLLYV